MSYAMSGKIAGLGLGFGRLPAPFNRGLRGLGDAAYDAAIARYNADLAAWNAEGAARVQAIVAQQKQILAVAVAQSRANAAAVAAGAIIPTGYSGCVSLTQHNSWQYECTSQNATNTAWVSSTVKGLGGTTTPSGPYCALALLPICASPPAPVPPLRPKPIPPVAPPPPVMITVPAPVIATAPASTPAPVPVPVPPVLNTAPQQIPPPTQAVPAPPATPAPTTASAGLVRNGLLLIVLAGGSYALYRTFKKPKAAA